MSCKYRELSPNKWSIYKESYRKNADSLSMMMKCYDSISSEEERILSFSRPWKWCTLSVSERKTVGEEHP